jgi:hypothetical protein
MYYKGEGVTQNYEEAIKWWVQPLVVDIRLKGSKFRGKMRMKGSERNITKLINTVRLPASMMDGKDESFLK